MAIHGTILNVDINQSMWYIFSILLIKISGYGPNDYHLGCKTAIRMIEVLIFTHCCATFMAGNLILIFIKFPLPTFFYNPSHSAWYSCHEVAVTLIGVSSCFQLEGIILPLTAACIFTFNAIDEI